MSVLHLYLFIFKDLSGDLKDLWLTHCVKSVHQTRLEVQVFRLAPKEDR